MFDFEQISNDIIENELPEKISGGSQLEESERFEDKVEDFRLMFEPLIEKSKSFEVCDEPTAKQALSMSLQARKIKNALDKIRHGIIKPHIDFQRSINKISKETESVLLDIEEKLSEKISEWISTRNSNSPIDLSKIDVEDGFLYTQANWTFDIEDLSKVPSEYLTVDVTKIKADIKSGIRTIKGLKIYEQKQIALRVKN